MRLLLVPIITVGLLTANAGHEPRPEQMRDAYRSALTLQVQEALRFVAEASGSEAVEQIHALGNDHFDIRDFQKLHCSAHADGGGFDCAFRLTITAGEREYSTTLSGRFIGGPTGLVFSEI
jgi:hypothetical protein